MSPSTLLVLTTCASAEDADRLGRALVESRLAACVNAVSGMTSTYRWQGEVRQDRETLLVIKTTEARYAALEQAICEHSTYDLPEVLAIPVHAGLPPYLAWLRESVAELKD
jgi:periplasmic divalent cation tolerance protein